MTEAEQYHLLENKLAVLDKIAKNAAIQLKFVRRQEIRGLERLLRERAQYLHSLTTYNARLKGRQALSSRCVALAEQIDGKRQEIMELYKKAIQAATTERDKLAAALRRSKEQRKVTANYQHPFLPASGRCFNSKG